MENTIRLLLVDDHAPAREALRQLLEFEPDLEVVGEASNGQQALKFVELLSPDIVLMDINMRKRKSHNIGSVTYQYFG